MNGTRESHKSHRASKGPGAQQESHMNPSLNLLSTRGRHKCCRVSPGHWRGVYPLWVSVLDFHRGFLWVDPLYFFVFSFFCDGGLQGSCCCNTLTLTGLQHSAALVSLLGNRSRVQLPKNPSLPRRSEFSLNFHLNFAVILQSTLFVSADEKSEHHGSTMIFLVRPD